MNPEQREFLLGLTESSSGWSVHESSMVWVRKGCKQALPVLDVLEAVCSQILSSRKAYPDPKARVAICNIVLQRVQASTPLSQAVQAELNARLFPEERAAVQAELNTQLFQEERAAQDREPSPRI